LLVDTSTVVDVVVFTTCWVVAVCPRVVVVCTNVVVVVSTVVLVVVDEVVVVDSHSSSGIVVVAQSPP
jgi:hypothetical protein